MTISTSSAPSLRIRTRVEVHGAGGRKVPAGAAGTATPLYEGAGVFLVDLAGGLGRVVLSAGQVQVIA